jgi:hypothetical protein
MRAFPREVDLLFLSSSATRGHVRLGVVMECFDELARTTKARTSDNDTSFTVCGPTARDDIIGQVSCLYVFDLTDRLQKFVAKSIFIRIRKS